ncbi:chaperone modulator CbpM [Aquimarina agarivorans]|nr:chaperone modulator CbpM [Aquimarina agarivorans]
MVFYRDLNINVAGIETVMHLLQRIENMQQEIQQLKNELNLYKN